jgi:hypothetical protein
MDASPGFSTTLLTRHLQNLLYFGIVATDDEEMGGGDNTKSEGYRYICTNNILYETQNRFI